MAKQKRVSSVCPYCATAMVTAAMSCPACGVEVRGAFHQSLFQRLGADDLQLLENYLLSGFSIKALEGRTGMGYAALRTRIDRLIDNYQALCAAEERRRQVLSRLEAGEIDPDQAMWQLAQIHEGETR